MRLTTGMRTRSHPALAALALSVLAALAPPAAAGAAVSGRFFPGETVDGPSPDIQSLADLDVARDGTGVLAEIKLDGGVPHVFASRLEGGAWKPPERVDAALAAASTEAAVAASTGERLVVAFVSGGSLFATVRPAGAPGWGTPQLIADGASAPSVDESINGAAYISFTVGGDVRVAQMARTATSFTVLPDVLDLAQGDESGTDTGRSRVAVSADGTAVVVFGERDSGGRMHVVGRRVFDQRVSTAPQDLTVDQLDGHAGGAADEPDIDIEDDSSFAWAVFREGFDNGGGATTTRVLARRLVGSQFDPPVAVDGQGWPASEPVGVPRIAMTGRGQGLAASAGASSGGVFGGVLNIDAWGPGARLDAGNGIAPAPAPAIAENGLGVIAWMQGAGASDAAVHARSFDDAVTTRAVPAPGPDLTLSDPAFGPAVPAGGLDAGGDRSGDLAVGFLQGPPDARRVVVAAFDRGPGSFFGFTTSKWRKFARPPLSWGPAFELWGPVTYTVQVDGQPIGATTDTKLVPANPVPDGLHTWRVVATDRRGQSVTSPSRNLRVDATPPTIAFRVTGVRKRGGLVKVAATVSDASTAAKVSGVAVVKISFGDGSATVIARRAAHRYGHGGAFTVRVSATDFAGNAIAVKRRIRIKR
jgi:hypothetical protein